MRSGLSIVKTNVRPTVNPMETVKRLYGPGDPLPYQVRFCVTIDPRQRLRNALTPYMKEVNQ